VIQDGNRRYARRRGGDAHEGHRAGAETTERVLEWCQDIGVEELTLYTFSTENFERPAEENEALFDLLCEKLHEFADADRVHENDVRIRAIGETEMLPERVQNAVEYAERRTCGYDRFVLNIALAYGGRSRLLEAAAEVAAGVETGDLEPTRSMSKTSSADCTISRFEMSISSSDRAATSERRTSSRGTPTETRRPSSFVRPSGRSSPRRTSSAGFEPTNIVRNPGGEPALAVHWPCSARSASRNSPKPVRSSTGFATRSHRANSPTPGNSRAGTRAVRLRTDPAVRPLSSCRRLLPAAVRHCLPAYPSIAELPGDRAAPIPVGC